MLGSEVTLTNNEIKDITKVSNSLENKGILLKGNTKKSNFQKGGLINFPSPSMKNALLLIYL